MYTQLRDSLSSTSTELIERRVPWWRVDRNVFNLGLTSFFTDISSEMISAATSARLSRSHTPGTSRTSLRPISAVDGSHGKVWL